MNRILLPTLLLLMAQTCRAQVYWDNRVYERHFLFEIKQIDEFIERFNDEPSSFLRRHINHYFPKVKVTRSLLLPALFDTTTATVNEPDLEAFVKQVTDRKHPSYLNFERRGWYAEAICAVRYRHREIDLSVLLEVRSMPGSSTEWAIFAVRCPQLRPYPGKLILPPPQDSSRFFSPMCHATNFMCLADIFDEPDDVQDFLAPAYRSDDQTRAFLHALLGKEITYLGVRTVRYHFQQVRGWEFTVENIERNDSYLSGWLICNLHKQNLPSPSTAK
jgi:hypothetical protein